MKIPKIKIKKKEKKVKKNKPKKNKFNIILMIFISLGIIVASTVLAFALYIIISSPDFVPQELYTKEASIIYANDGVTEIARYGNENVELITYSDLPQVLIDALVATEDSRFFQHNGFDAARFIKASLGQLAGQNAGGASTLSMQLIKNTYTSDEAKGLAGIIRKFTDIYMAVFKLEAVYTKEEIMEFYLNSQWLSVSGSIYSESINGVEQGSQYFFGKSVSDLTLPEASLLVGMFNNPFYLNPYTYPKAASDRRSVVLNLMVRHGYITEEEKEFAESVPVQSLLATHSSQTNNEYQAFIDLLIAQIKEETGDDPKNVPMAIYTTVDPNIQSVLRQLETGQLYKFANDKVQFGMAITDTQNGAILGISGGRNYVHTGTNRAVSPKYGGIKRQLGSTAKILFDYGPYIEYLNGSTGTIFIDKPWTYTTGGSIVNSNRDYAGPITMRSALVASRNIPAVQAYQQVAAKVGVDKIGEFVHSLGIDYGDTLYESYAIGGGIYSDPVTMSAAYAAFGRGGYYIEPYTFTKIVYLETGKPYTHQVERTRVMSEQTAYMITDMLITGGYSGVGGVTISGTEIAAKGGTTTISAAEAKQVGIPAYATPDHWNITYSPDYSIALWYGYDNHNEGYLTSNTGYPTRKAIMKAVGTKVYKKNSKFNKPSGVTSVTIEKETYPTALASSHTPNNLKLTETFKSGYEPAEVSTRFDTLKDPTNGKATYNGSYINVSWDPIATPDAINTEYLENMYNDEYWQFYEKYKSEYYQARVNYNATNMGDIGYHVYVKDSTGNLTHLGFTRNTYYNYPTAPSNTNYQFVIRSAYSIYKDNISNGLTIKAQSQIDDNLGNIGGPTDDDNDDLD